MLTIAAPGGTSTDYEIVTGTTFKAFAGISTSADDSLIAAIVAGVNRSVYRELGGRFIKSTGTVYDRVLDSDGGRKLWLPDYPIVAVNSIAYVQMAGNDSWTTLTAYSATDYQVNKANGIVTSLLLGWPSGTEVLRVQYTAGFATIPTDLTAAVHEWVMVKYQRVKSKRIDAISVAAADQAVSYTVDDLPSSVRRVFDGYRYLESTVG